MIKDRDSRTRLILSYAESGHAVREIVAATGIHQATVYRTLVQSRVCAVKKYKKRQSKGLR